MKTPGRFIYLSILFALALSCKEDKKTIVCFPSSRTTTFPSSTSTSTFVYDANNRLTSETYVLTEPGVGTSSGTTTYSYDANGRVATATTSSPGSNTSITSYTYDGSGRISTSSYNSGGFVYTQTYTYNATGQMATHTYSGSGFIETYNYTYPNTSTKNYSTETVTSGGSTSVTTYEYDAKLNPSRSIAAMEFNPTDNNVTKRTQGTNITVFTYAYNEHGYPTSVTIVGNSSGTITFVYNCK